MIEKDLNSRHLFAFVKEVDEQNPNLVHAIISTDEIDRYDEIVQPAAIKEALPAFLANNVVLGCHQNKLATGEPPVIGNVPVDSIRIGEHQIEADILFDDDELGSKYARKYRKKVMKAFSIGFKPIEGMYKDVLEAAKKVWVWTKIELLELSAVAVPANRTALARACGYYEGEGEETKEMILKEVRGILDEKMKKIEEELDEIKCLLAADPGKLAESLLGDDYERPDHAAGFVGAEKSLEKIEKLFIGA